MCVNIKVSVLPIFGVFWADNCNRQHMKYIISKIIRKIINGKNDKTNVLMLSSGEKGNGSHLNGFTI